MDSKPAKAKEQLAPVGKRSTRVKGPAPKKVGRPRNYALVPGLMRFSKARMYQRKALYKRIKHGERPAHVGEGAPKPRKISKRAAPRRPLPLKKSLTPGTICILLSGRHKGKRVVFLKQLRTGLILVNGKIAFISCYNTSAVILRSYTPRKTSSYVYSSFGQLTSEDTYIGIYDEMLFVIGHIYGVLFVQRLCESFYRSFPREQMSIAPHRRFGPVAMSKNDTKKERYVVSDDKKKDQKEVDKVILTAMRKHPDAKLMWKYLRAVFGLRHGMFPHKRLFCEDYILKEVMDSGLFNDLKDYLDLGSLSSPDTTQRTFIAMRNEAKPDPIPISLMKSWLEDKFHAPSGVFEENFVPSDWSEIPEKFDKITDEDLRDFALVLNDEWKKLVKKIRFEGFAYNSRYSLYYLPSPFPVTGGRFREFHYWDTYWILKGLLSSGMWKTARGMLLNMVLLVEDLGFVPEGGRVYYQHRSGPPMFIPMVKMFEESMREILGYAFLGTKAHNSSFGMDTYWILKGLLSSGMWKTARGILLNMVLLVEDLGFVPEGGRVYYQHRSGPPMFIPMVKMFEESMREILGYAFLGTKAHNSSFGIDYLDSLENELEFWLESRLVQFKHGGKERIACRYSVDSNFPRAEEFPEDYRMGLQLEKAVEKLDYFSEVKSASESGWLSSSRWMPWKNSSDFSSNLNLNQTRFIACRYSVDSNFPRAEEFPEDYRMGLQLEKAVEKLDYFSEVKSASESGWLSSSRWMPWKNSSDFSSSDFKHLPETSQVLPVDLNALMCYNARVLAEYYEKVTGDKNNVMAVKYRNTSRMFAEVIKDLMYDPQSGSWFDFSLRTMSQRKGFYLSNVYPLWLDCLGDNVNKEQVGLKFLQYLKKNRTSTFGRRSPLGFPGGVPVSMTPDGLDWDFPNVYPPLVHVLVEALGSVGHPDTDAAAFRIAQQLVTSVERTYNETGLFFRMEQVGLKFLQYLKKNRTSTFGRRSPLGFPGGVPVSMTPDGLDWDFPNVYPPLVHVLVEALGSVGHPDTDAAAFRIAQQLVTSVERTYNETGLFFRMVRN
ncbi:unnamed protein product [Notodromas monacha]|uniref:Trehalase n=1 Tax=Notodromas monacha TaxID=399045 RepID=A0A7R9BX97_9CRUS|nr:unnamed protein product [Notodromas monacha]CAG0922363.1 unnamed protein product [Notodromas monacha]